MGGPLPSTEVYEATPEGEVVNTITFTENEGRTTLAFLVQSPSKEVRDAIIDSGMEVGMQKAWDFLEQIAVSLN